MVSDQTTGGVPEQGSVPTTGVVRKAVNFGYITPTDAQIELMQKYRDKYQALNDELVSEGLMSRGFSLALTNLEQSSFWLNKAITRND